MNKSIEELENDYWNAPNSDSSYVVRNSFIVRKKKINELTNEDLRFMLSQRIGTKYILPIAINRLKENPFIECDYFPGDLLIAVFKLRGKDLILENEIELIREIALKRIDDIDVTEEIKADIVEAIN